MKSNARLYEVHVTIIYSHAILVAVTLSLNKTETPIF